MSSLIPFSFESHSVRAFNIDGNPWFVAKDVALALDYSESSNPARLFSSVPDEWKGVNPIHTLGGIQEVLCLSEPGLYFFLNRSDKLNALPFQKWLAGEVLPSIRKTGSYQLSDTSHDLPVIESSLVLDYQGVPIRFLIDAHGEWMATYADVATALGYVNKEQQYNARNILKYTVKSGQRQLRHPLYGDLINLAGMERVLAQLARNAACMPEPASLAVNLKEWLDKTAKSLINQPVSAGRLLEAPQARALEMTPIDWEFTQAVQVFECWFAVLGDVVLTTRQVIDRAAGTPLAGLLLDIAEGRRSPGVVSSLRLGIWLARRVGWNFNGWVLPPVITRKNDVKRWTLRKVAP